MPPAKAQLRVATRALVGALVVLAAGCGAEETGAPRTADDGTSGTAGAPRVKNVLLFVVDTLRADRLGAYGYERDTSPHVDAFAREGTTWLDNRSQSNWTNPSMVSLMTGLWVTDEEQVLPPRYPTLAELFQESGFSTAAFVANATLTTGRGFQRGFDDFTYENAPGPTLVQHFTDWLDERAAAKDERGWFAWVHLLDPHAPYEPATSFDVFEGPGTHRAELERRWSRDVRSIVGNDDAASTPEYAAGVARMQAVSNLYDGEVRQADEAFGRALAALRANGSLDETLVVFAADHGELLFEYRRYPHELETLRSHKTKRGETVEIDDHFALGHRDALFFPELWNTPLIVRGPGFERGAQRRGLSANLDIFTTVLAATQVTFEGERPGVDLAVADLEQRKHVFARGFGTSAVLEVGGLQLVDYPPTRFLLKPTAPRVHELFDLTTGPELLPLQAERPAEAARLNDVIASWRKRWQRSDSIETVDSPEVRQALRELGYLDDE